MCLTVASGACRSAGQAGTSAGSTPGPAPGAAVPPSPAGGQAASGAGQAAPGTDGGGASSPYGGGGAYPSGPPVSGALATAEPVADLRVHCRDIAQHRFLGTRRLNVLEQGLTQVERLPVSPRREEQLITGYVELGIERLRQAQFDRVLAEFEHAWKIASDNHAPATTMAQLAYYRGVAKMRLGEVTNCANSHNPYQCILQAGPLGAFQDPSSVASAMADFELTLTSIPDHVGARWLLNIAAVLLGTFPEGVPDEWRIPPERFSSAHQAPEFRNIAHDLDVATVSQAGSAFLEDFDNDGRLDVLTTSLNPCESVRYFHNDGSGRLVDETQQAGLADQLGAFGGQQTDYNNDGFVDVFLTRGGWQNDSGRFRRSLLKNNGNGTFTDVSMAAGLAGPAYPTQTSAWADFDGDGDLDVFIGNEATDKQQIYPSQLFRNNGDGTFTNVAAAAGLENNLMAKGAAWGDFDNDDDPDLYVSNLGPNRLYRNNGDGTFTDVAPELGVTEPAIRSFSTWFFDYDNDGWLDIFVSDYDAVVEDIAKDYMAAATPATSPAAASMYPRLYRNNQHGGFDDVTTKTHLNRVLNPMGSNFGDVDNDGYPDIYLATGDPSFWTIVPNVMFWNDRGSGFVDVTQSSGTGYFPKGHGVSFGDLDNDGDQDFMVQSGGFFAGDTQPDALFENPGAGNHFVTLKLVGERSNRAAIGARISLTVADGATERLVHDEVSTGSSFGANSLQQEIGLGQATIIKTMRIHWPTSHTDQEFHDVAVDQFLEIREGATAFDVQPRTKIDLHRMPTMP